MPSRYAPKTDITLSEEAAKQLEFLALIERARMNDQTIPVEDLVERLIAAKYEKTQKAFNQVMESLEKEA
jgi:hypothetical protein